MKFPKNLASVEKLIFLIIVFIVFFAMINVSTGCNCTDTYKDSGLKIGIANPAAVYCGELGYEYKIITCNEGGQKGICVFPDKSECGAWNFFTGKCGQKYSYCRKHGYDIETVMDGKSPFSQECAVCVLPNRTKTPVTELMKLDERILKCSIKNESEMNVSEIAEEIELYLPSTFDWRNKDGSNWLTPVKDQGGCGSCWAFSAVGTVEPQYNIFYDNPDFDPDLSEQYLVSDCCADCGDCGGGWPATALEFTRYEGITDEVCFPYIASNCPCSDRCSDWSYRLWKINYTAGPLPDDIETIKKYLIEKGPLSVCMGVGFDYGGHFDKEIYKCDDDIGANHAVVIVGYNDTGNYWIVRNSWGQDWNEDGYFKVGYGECSIENYVYYANLAKNLFYCPASTNNADYEWIKRVELNGKEKNSGSSTYNNFTDEVLTTLKRGDTYTLYVDGHTTSSYLEFVKVWIDFNNNKDFIDLGEEIDLGNYTFEGDHIFSANFKVPGDAVLSDTRMRVYLKYGGEPDPCENASYGEIEDYTVEIISPAILTDNYSDYGIDTDEPGDGYYNYMAIDVGVNVTEPGYYTIRGGIYDELGNSTDYASNYTYLESGNHSITLKFSGIEIRVNGVSGTFNLKRLYLWDESYNEVDYRYDAYTTSYYNYTDFQEGGIIAGRVTYENGTGIYEAEVYASGPSYKSTYTNTIGYYSIVGLEAGSYTATAYPPYGTNLIRNSTTASVTLGETTTVNFILQEGGIIAGRVTYENGTGIYNARVYASGPSYKSAYTNITGYYSIIGLLGGSYTVTASPPYGTNLVSNSTTATVNLGETTIVNFVLREGGIIAGRVIYENGTGIYNAYVEAYNWTFGIWKYDYTNETGYYEIVGLEAGTYTVTAYPPYGTNLVSNTTTASVALSETTIVDIILPEAGIIAGRVTYENGTGIYNSYVYATGPSYGYDYTNITGYYSIIGLLAGNYTVTASPPYGTDVLSNSTAASVTLGETTVVDFVLHPPPDIWVYPMYFNVTLSQGNVTNRTLSIGNNGSGVLEFGIAEDALIITDPNEGTLVDIKNVYAGVSPTHINFRVETYTSITEEAYGIMWLDADQNSSTGVTDEWWPGYGLNDIGGEYAVSLNTYYVEAYLYRWTGDSFEFVSYLPLSLNAYYFTISIPLSDIADDGIMDVTLMMEDYYGSIDIAPDEGHGTTGIGANWLSESPTSGTVDPDNQTEITVTINATDLEVGEYSASILVNSNDPDENLVVVPVLLIVTPTTGFDFDTGSPTNPYPSIFGMHNGTIKPNQTITVHKLYTYPCAGTGGHTERVKIWNDTWPGKEAHWKAYQGDWHNITFDEPFTLFAEKTYYYEIRTGSYPQIIHKPEHTTVDGSFINCTEFTDANGKTYNNWIPAIKLFL